MSSEQVPPPPSAKGEVQAVEAAAPHNPETVTSASAQPQLRFSFVHWFVTGVVRLLYRRWTRIAAHLFPENSPGERVAQKLHIPLPDQLNMSWVNDSLAVGGRIRPEDIPALARAGVTHVVDTRAEYCDDKEALAQEHIELLYLPAPDTYPLSIEQLLQGAQWAHEHIQNGGRVLIHCEHGVGRSVLLTCAVLVYGGMRAYEALQLVMSERWQAAPNYRQIERLQQFEAELRRQKQE